MKMIDYKAQTTAYNLISDLCEDAYTDRHQTKGMVRLLDSLWRRGHAGDLTRSEFLSMVYLYSRDAYSAGDTVRFKFASRVLSYLEEL